MRVPLPRTRAEQVLDAYRVLAAYANPLRVGLPLSSTEQAAVTRAVALLRGNG